VKRSKARLIFGNVLAFPKLKPAEKRALKHFLERVT
jgi:hypothetical protein